MHVSIHRKRNKRIHSKVRIALPLEGMSDRRRKVGEALPQLCSYVTCEIRIRLKE